MFEDRISLCSPGWPRTPLKAQTGLELEAIPLPQLSFPRAWENPRPGVPPRPGVFSSFSSPKLCPAGSALPPLSSPSSSEPLGPHFPRGVHPSSSLPWGPSPPPSPPDTKEGAGSAECARVCQLEAGLSNIFRFLRLGQGPPSPGARSFQEAFEIPTTWGGAVCLFCCCCFPFAL